MWCKTRYRGIDPGNDPNFVFLPDPEFDQLTLFNSDGTAINVNSWTDVLIMLLVVGLEKSRVYTILSKQFWILFGISMFYLTKSFL